MYAILVCKFEVRNMHQSTLIWESTGEGVEIDNQLLGKRSVQFRLMYHRLAVFVTVRLTRTVVASPCCRDACDTRYVFFPC